MYNRLGEKLLQELLNEFRILYLTGPRQAGKTTLAQQIAKDLGMHYISLDEQTALASALSDPPMVLLKASMRSLLCLMSFNMLQSLFLPLN